MSRVQPILKPRSRVRLSGGTIIPSFPRTEYSGQIRNGVRPPNQADHAEPLFSSRSRNPIPLVRLLSPFLLSRDLRRRPSFSGLCGWPSSFDLQRRLPRLILLRSTVSLSSEPRAAGERVRVDLAAGQQRRHTSESAAPPCSTEKPAMVARGDAKAKPLIPVRCVDGWILFVDAQTKIA